MPFEILSLLSCFGRDGSTAFEPVRSDAKAQAGCIFCNISRSRGFDVVWENSELVVFRDRDPGAREHLLVTPIKHIRSVRELRRGDVPFLKDMQEAGQSALDGLNIPTDSRRLGFHIPPFNTVDHLHLHALGLPFRSAYHQAKYPISEGAPGKTKGYSWFVEIDQAISILTNGGIIRVSPS